MYGTAQPPRRAALLVTPGAMDPRSAQTRSVNSAVTVAFMTLETSCNVEFIIFLLLCFQGKMGNKPDEAWIMNRLIKQLTDMGFPV